MGDFIMKKQLDEKIMARVRECGKLLSETKTVPIILHGNKYQVEYLIIPAMTREGELKSAIFNYPGGMTHLAPCIEPFIFLDRRSIHISPLGYGKSSDIPGWIFMDDPFHGAEVALQVLKTLGENRIALYGHSNASSIILEMVLRAFEYEIEIPEIKLVNPLGLRKISKMWVAVAFPIFGILSRIFSWGYENPLKLLKGSYISPRHALNFWKIRYELKKSSKARLPSMFQEMRERNLNIPITVIQSYWDWARFHMPWTRSNEEILRENTLVSLLRIIKMSGLHNMTLGKESKQLSKFL